MQRWSTPMGLRLLGRGGIIEGFSVREERGNKMSSLNQQTDGKQAANTGEHQILLDLKAELSALTTKYPSSGFTFGGGAAQAQEQIPTICRNIDDAIGALNTGFDPHGNPITKAQITDGLKRLVEATRNPAFVGLVTVVLNSDGIQQLEHLMSELKRIAENISRPE